VHTDQGTVEVLGTEFNVKSRPTFFEVICYVGLVQVSYNSKIYKIPSGKSFRAFDNQIFKDLTIDIQPSWMEHKSAFKSVPVF